MKKFMTLAVICTVLAGIVLTGCEQKSDSEKALDGFKKDVKSMTK